MSQAAHILGASRPSYVRVVAAVCAAHFVSHYFIILLAPLMPFVRAEYGVSYTEIGLAFVAFNIVTATLQTPAGFLVDRFGARPLLVAGGGVIYSEATEALRALVEATGIPVAETQAGKGSLPWNHPLAVGAVGVGRNDVEEVRGNTGVGQVRGDAGPHGARA